MVRLMHRLFVTLAACFGFVSVALGAFGAHGLRNRLAALPDGAQRLDWWQTAALYNLTHALALLIVASLFGQARAGQVACIAFSLGIVVFSGSLYTMTLTGMRALGAVTPIGGLALLVGWAAFAVAAWSAR
jgi:uncharacterized membrane protein YgdD (TMEM256/DUF423 family)